MAEFGEIGNQLFDIDHQIDCNLMSVQEVFCPICVGAFIGLKPMILSCGHSICEECLQKVSSLPSFNCFYCGKFYANSTDEPFPRFVNYGLWGLIKSMSMQNGRVTVAKEAFEKINTPYREQKTQQVEIEIPKINLIQEQTNPTASINFNNGVTSKQAGQTVGKVQNKRGFNSKRIRRRAIRC